MRTVIFANGEFTNSQGAQDLSRSAGLVIAADGGTHHALAVDVVPDVVIGDLDSLSPQERVRLETAGSRLIPFSPRKDETDLELALLHAARGGATEIVILAALGGRLDQTVANLLLLALPELDGLDVRIVNGPQMAFLIRGGQGGDDGGDVIVEGQPGDIISLIPLGGDAVGVTTDGVAWPLQEDTLRFGPARGVSNVLTARQARVRVREGVLLCVVIRQE